MGITASGYPSDFQCDQCCGNRQLGFSADTPYYPYRLSQADFTDDGNYSSQRSDLSASVRYTGTDLMTIEIPSAYLPVCSVLLHLWYYL